MNVTQDTEPKIRIKLIDALRGYALMGLFIVHMVEYFELYCYNPDPGIYKDIAFGLFGGKAYAIFSLLFGLSFFIIMDRQKKQGIDFRGRFAWRVTLLLFAGFLHSIVYGGDILQILAITGFLLIPIYYARNYLLIILAAIFLLQIPAIIYFFLFVFEISARSTQPLHWELMGAVHSIYANGSFSEVFVTNMGQGVVAKWTFFVESGRLSIIIGMSILGFWMGKIGFFKNDSIYKNKYKITFIVSLLLAILLLLAKPYFSSLFNTPDYWMTGAFLNSYIDLAFTFVSIFAFVFLYQINPVQKVLGLLAAPGRMSLTIYVFQSIIFVPIFYGYGFAAYSYIGQPISFYLGIILWVSQVGLASYWIKNYYYGPLEWLWRSATYLTRGIKFKRQK